MKPIKLYSDKETYEEHILRDRENASQLDGKKCHCVHLEELENKVKEHDEHIMQLINTLLRRELL